MTIIRYIPALILALLTGPVLAADVNGYTAQYECRAGGPQCNVDVATLTTQACQQTITTATTPTNNWDAIDWSKNVICIAAGDHRARGTIRLPVSGTNANRKVLRYDGDTSDDPWRQAAKPAVVQNIDTNGKNYWVIHRLSHDANGSRAIWINGSTNIIVNRVLVSNSGIGNGAITIEGGESNTVQNSVVRSCKVQHGAESHGVTAGGGVTNARIVNSEIYDCGKDVYVWESGSANAPGLVIENNDIYISTAAYSDCNGNYSPTGECSTSEVVINFKSGGTQASPVSIIHNRIWGARPCDTALSCDSTSEGEILATSVGGPGTPRPYTGADWFLIKNNIIFDGQQGIVATGYGTDVRLTNHSVIGNVIWKMHTYNSRFGTHGFNWNYRDSNEMYLNTIVDVKGIAGQTWKSWFATGSSSTNNDILCNVIIDGEPKAGTLDTGSRMDSNAYYGTPNSGENNSFTNGITDRANGTMYPVGTVLRVGASSDCRSPDSPSCFLYKVTQAGVTDSGAHSYCTTLGCTTTIDGSLQVTAVRGPLVFRRKLLTVTSGEVMVVPYAIPGKSAPEANGCPQSTGTRSVVGINDNPLFN